jgi:hypothetical protein
MTDFIRTDGRTSCTYIYCIALCINGALYCIEIVLRLHCIALHCIPISNGMF